jgi:chromosome segregation ATPase
MVDLKKSISHLQEKLSSLIKLYVAAEKENQQLKATIETQKKVQADLELKIKEGQGQLTAALMNQGGGMDPAEKAKLIKKIDQYIKEIDNGINNLNP